MKTALCIACRKNPRGTTYFDALFCDPCLDATKGRIYDDENIETLAARWEAEENPHRPHVYHELAAQQTTAETILATLRLAWKIDTGLRLLELIAYAETKAKQEPAQ